jgi:tetratricopeptide (TPR) repeat protein
VTLGAGEDVLRALLVRALGPLAHARPLRELLGKHGVPDPEGVEALLASSEPPQGLIHAAQTVRETLVALSGGRPLVVWLDEADQATSASPLIEALRAVCYPLLLVCSARSSPLVDGALTLTLTPLPPSAVTGLLQELVPLEPGLAVWITEQSSGLPLVALALLGELIDRGGLVWSGLHWKASSRGLTVPESVRALFHQRVDRALQGLPPSARRWVELAAVLGPRVELEMWEELGSALSLPPRHEKLVRKLVEGGVLSVDPRNVSRLSFTHALLADAVAARCADRAALHALAGEHYLARGDRDCERAATHWLAAGQVDRAMEAWFEASRYWSTRDLLVAKEMALKALARKDASSAWVARLAAKLAGIYCNLGDLYRGQDAASRGLLRVDAETDPDTAVALYDARAWANHGLRQLEEEAQDLQKIRELMPRVTDQRLMWRVWTTQGLRRTESGPQGLQEAIELFDLAAEVAPLEGLRDEVQTFRAAALLNLGRTSEAEAELSRLHARLTPDEPLRLANWLSIHGTMLAQAGQREGLRELWQSLELRRNLGGLPTIRVLELAIWAVRFRDPQIASLARTKVPAGLESSLGALVDTLVAAAAQQPAQAARCLDQMERLDAKLQEWLEFVGDVLGELGDPELRAAVERAVARHPG